MTIYFCVNYPIDLTSTNKYSLPDANSSYLPHLFGGSKHLFSAGG